MTVSELFDEIKIQGEIKIVYVNDGGIRVEIPRELAEDAEAMIARVYCEGNILYVEIERFF